MRSDPHRLRYALSACQLAGVHLTDDRRLLLEKLAASPLPRVVETLVRDMCRSTGAHFVTFYRFLHQLEAGGVIYATLLSRKRAVALTCGSVDYLLCVRCGLTTPLAEPPELRLWKEALGRRTGFLFTRHHHEISGLCPACQTPSP